MKLKECFWGSIGLAFCLTAACNAGQEGRQPVEPVAVDVQDTAWFETGPQEDRRIDYELSMVGEEGGPATTGLLEGFFLGESSYAYGVSNDGVVIGRYLESIEGKAFSFRRDSWEAKDIPLPSPPEEQGELWVYPPMGISPGGTFYLHARKSGGQDVPYIGRVSTQSGSTGGVGVATVAPLEQGKGRVFGRGISDSRVVAGQQEVPFRDPGGRIVEQRISSLFAPFQEAWTAPIVTHYSFDYQGKELLPTGNSADDKPSSWISGVADSSTPSEFLFDLHLVGGEYSFGALLTANPWPYACNEGFIAWTQFDVDSLGQIVTPNPSGQFRSMPGLGASGKQRGACDINAGGVAVGSAAIKKTDETEALRWLPCTWPELTSFPHRPGAIGALPVLHEDGEGIALAINSRDEIVGTASTESGGQHAVLWSDGQIHDLNDRLVDRARDYWTLLVARDINDSGVIVGVGLYRGQQRGFALYPPAID